MGVPGSRVSGLTGALPRPDLGPRDEASRISCCSPDHIPKAPPPMVNQGEQFQRLSSHSPPSVGRTMVNAADRHSEAS
jgi:hypothetical protein